MRAWHLPRGARAYRALCVFIAAILPVALTRSPLVLARATFWLIVEAIVALLISLALALSARTAVAVRYQQHVEVLISRGLELVAALPLILSVAALAFVTPMPTPVAIALVIGSLAGLRHLKHIISARITERAAVPSIGPHAPSVLQAIPGTIEQLITLEAAVAWLGLVDRAGSGGWGEHLGRHARQGDVTGLFVWTLAAVGLSQALGMLTCRFPVRSVPRPVARTPDPHA